MLFTLGGLGLDVSGALGSAGCVAALTACADPASQTYLLLCHMCVPGQVRVAYDIFMLSGVLDELRIPESELTGFLSAVSAHYHSPEDVPYHNLSHVVQVLHAVWLVSRCCCWVQV
jgi:hypothetical protein